MGDISKCASCGYEWQTGKNGSHSCSEKLQLTVFKLNVDLINLKDKLEKANKLIIDANDELVMHIGYCKGTKIPNRASQVHTKISFYLDTLDA